MPRTPDNLTDQQVMSEMMPFDMAGQDDIAGQDDMAGQDGMVDNVSQRTASVLSDEHLDLAKRYIELAGGIENARDLLDKLEECGECLGVEPDETEAIEGISDTMPSMPDLPNTPSSQFDPGNPGMNY